MVDRDKDTVLKDLQTVNTETAQVPDAEDRKYDGKVRSKQCFGL